jgi:excisionase family DNA binding protein
MAARDAAEQLFRDNVKAARLCLVACLYKAEDEWLKRSLTFHRLGMSANSLYPCIEDGFHRFVEVGKASPTRINTSPVKWAKGQTASVLKKRLKAYRASDVPLAEVLRFLDELAAKQTLQEPLPDERTDEETGVAEAEKRRALAIKKVSEPGKYHTVRTDEAADYFECSKRTVNRWIRESKLKAGEKLGTVTTESVRKLGKKRKRKPSSAT